MHSLSANKKDLNVALKLDMAKLTIESIRLSWTLCYSILVSLVIWVQLVRNCVQNYWFSVLINGSLSGFFKSTRGLRQGDPLSSSLFILASEHFSRRPNHFMEANRTLAFHGSEGVSHLAYADDVLIFSNSVDFSLNTIMEFQPIFGQRISLPKSSFVVSPKALMLVKHKIKRIMGFVLKPLLFTYLGAPIYVGQKKLEYFNTLIELLSYKIGRWEKKFLSYGSRLNLLKSVLAAMSIHLISVLKPPIGTVQHIERLFNKFFGGSLGTIKRLHWFSWHHI
ncbi:UNVERIFIED_CONTAM: hypothetical protein Scaly_0459800 [Sesamum calycinum]|uniref:Reverse transcriptase domain-containing protein n=1 Tax=Sesamum calycinum TaxID=2727403 RepID=A0AAW2SG22_9LAMI